MITWYLARGAGLAALVLLSTATALGSRNGTAGRRYVLQYAHRAAAGLGLITLALHLVAVLSDSYANVGWRGALVPFTSDFKPQWVALGTVAAYLFLGVSLLGMARGRMASSPTGTRLWRGVHGLAYVGWLAAITHGFTTGTDSETGWVRLLYVACLVAVLGCTAARITARRTRDDAGRLTVSRPLQGVVR